MKIETAPPSKPIQDRDQAWLYAVTCTHDKKYDWTMFPNTISRFVDNKLIITPVDLYTNEPITVTPWRDTKDED